MSNRTKPYFDLSPDERDELADAEDVLNGDEDDNNQLYDPDHWNPAEGGNKPSDDYW
jgi:hypothetical protein